SPPTAVAKTGPFPRRLLFIHISKYMYLNPLTGSSPSGDDRTKMAASRLAFELQVPNDTKNADANQLFLLSDKARPGKQKGEIQIAMKNVVTGAYEQFFNTSRPQDRIAVYFGGHALERDGKVYLAPVEGDPDDVEATLIPLADFYAKLDACK